MNAFRLAGDIIHALGILLLLVKIAKTKSCSGVSGVTQVLFLTTYITRYLDLGTFISYYNQVMKHLFISATAFTVFLMFLILSGTHDSKHDSKWMYLILLPPAVLSLSFNFHYIVLEVAWAFSQYLEAVAIVPQFVMIFRAGQAEVTVVHYMRMLALYRLLYVCNWIYRYYYEGHYDITSFASGTTQTVLYLMFFIVYHMADKSTASDSELGDATEKEVLLDKNTDPSNDSFIHVKGLTPYYEKAVTTIDRLRLMIYREWFGLFGTRRTDATVKTETPTKQHGNPTDAESASDKPGPDMD